MDTIIINSKNNISMELIGERLSLFDDVEESENRIAVGFITNNVYLHLDREDDKCLMIDYNVFSSVRKVLLAMANDTDFIVDDDFGNALRGDEYVALLRSRPDWDIRDEYRRNSPNWAELTALVDEAERLKKS